MYKVKILIVCGSGVATSMHAAYKLQQYFDDEKISVHMPRIGCGLGGGKWEEVEPIIRTLLKYSNVFVYDFD